ncbi:MAG TPA: hypothetical protein VMU10_09045 [Desulfomonilia bacterium]|nr:hypothetical protein [Desulfomonilia bacterium]
MKRSVLIILAIVCVFLLTSPLSSGAAPICRVMSSYYIPSRIEFNDYVLRYGESLSTNQNHGYSFTLPFPNGQGRLSSIGESERVLAGMFFVPQDNIAQLKGSGYPFVNLLIHLFVGSFLIGLSGFIKSITNNPSRVRYVKSEIKAGPSYDHALSAET